jgi:hypothetical protein
VKSLISLLESRSEIRFNSHISCWHSGKSVRLNVYLPLTFKENQYTRFRMSRLQTTGYTSNHITSVCHIQHFPYDRWKSVSMPRLFPTDCAVLTRKFGSQPSRAQHFN